MRALVRFAAAVLATAACGPNPLFKLAGESQDSGVGSESCGDEGTSAASTSEPALPCEPAPETPIADVCEPWAPFEYPSPPNLAVTEMLKDVTCGEVSDISIKRVDDSTLQLCTEGCESCDPAKFISVDGVLEFTLITPHLPPNDVCTRLWHVARPTPSDPLAPCKSVAYAFWDAGDSRQLRFAFASGSLNPFAGVTGLPLTFTELPPDLCAEDQVMAPDCTSGAKAEPVTVDVDGCEFTARQGELWQNIPLGALTYDFQLRAFTCIGGDTTPRFSWLLRRSQ